MIVTLQGKNKAIELDDGFASELRAFGLQPEVIEALKITMAHASYEIDSLAYGYARWMRKTLIEYGLIGIKHQTLNLLSRMKQWDGKKARKCKRILKKWAKQ